ncbi:hypothetical protein LC048_02685 [Mesobacillus subterraneus]|uniref:hypothetical protein n=1 Tax=Mesobacillus subterraneus TaxID=285983 RepID=UPI00273FCEEE|nr:hypothetical protein [Mesobacillus subterraneus]WLR55925.1 hypothetical protein LC048_02685 [Mesobacillus subterraneus]
MPEPHTNQVMLNGTKQQDVSCGDVHVPEEKAYAVVQLRGFSFCAVFLDHWLNPSFYTPVLHVHTKKRLRVVQSR